MVNDENIKKGYESAPKDQNKGQIVHQARLLKKENEKARKRKDGAKL